jgi:uncharacterized Zn-finger protein
MALFVLTDPPPMSRPDPTAAPLIASNAENRYRVSASDLPLACPMPGMHLWNSHPRVYLPIEATGRARCPYCGAVYELEDHHSDAA